MIEEFDVAVGDRRVHGYTWGTGERTVLWTHGTPNIGSPPQPLFPLAENLKIRFIGYDRPGYGTSSDLPGRTIGAASIDAAAVADHLGISQFSIMGHSGGGTHALGIAARLPTRVTGVAAISALAPFDADGLDWFAHMGPGGEAGLRAAVAGRTEKENHDEPDEPDFLPADWEALKGPWQWFGSIVTPALANGRSPLIDDDLAYVSDWAADLSAIKAPALLVHGTGDRICPSTHSTWLAAHIPDATLRLVPDAGHISVLPAAAEDTLRWLADLG